MRLFFWKMHGLGNDFIIINQADLDQLSLTEPQLVKLIAMMADRKLGVGCDQLIIYNLTASNTANMAIYNIDGSEALACGNASRCLAQLIFQQHSIQEVTLKVRERLIYCQQQDKLVKVNMGPVLLNPSNMPSNDQLWDFAQQHALPLKQLACASVGNQHLIIFKALSEADQAIIGAICQKSPLFPDGVNVNFAQIVNNVINLTVWERGVGFTLACGSGAVAAYAAAHANGLVADQTVVKFALGELIMSKEQEQIWMCGPTEFIFSGEYCV